MRERREVMVVGETHTFQPGEERAAHVELDILLMEVKEGMQAGDEGLAGADS